MVRSFFQSKHKFIQYFLLLLCLQMPYHERADPRFVWNGHLLRELANQPELCRFCLPLLHGCILLVLSITHTHTHTHMHARNRSFMHAYIHSFIHSFMIYVPLQHVHYEIFSHCTQFHHQIVAQSLHLLHIAHMFQPYMLAMFRELQV